LAIPIDTDLTQDAGFAYACVRPAGTIICAGEAVRFGATARAFTTVHLAIARGFDSIAESVAASGLLALTLGAVGIAAVGGQSGLLPT